MKEIKSHLSSLPTGLTFDQAFAETTKEPEDLKEFQTALKKENCHDLKHLLKRTPRDQHQKIKFRLLWNALAAGDAQSFQRALDTEAILAQQINLQNLALQVAVEQGNLSVTENIVKFNKSQTQIDKIIAVDDYQALFRAAKKRDFPTTAHINTRLPNTFEYVQNHFLPKLGLITLLFKEALEEENIPLFNRLFELLPQGKYGAMIYAVKDARDISAAMHLTVLKRLQEVVTDPKKMHKLLLQDKSALFWKNAEAGNIEGLKILLELTKDDPEVQQEMIHEDNDYAFRVATRRLYPEILGLLIAKTPHEQTRHKMVCDHRAFLDATITSYYDTEYSAAELEKREQRRLETIQLVLENVKDDDARSGLIRRNYYDLESINMFEAAIRLLAFAKDEKERQELILESKLFGYAARHGRLDVMQTLLSQVKKEKHEEMIHADNDFAFREAARSRRPEIIEYLIGLTTNVETRHDMIHINDNEPFLNATFCEPRRSETMRLLLSYIPNTEEQQAMIRREDSYAPFLNACSNDLTLLTEFLNLMPVAERMGMISSADFCIFREAAKHGNIEVIKYLIDFTKLQPALQQEMIHAYDDQAFSHAVEKNDLALVNLLLELTPDARLRQEMIRQNEQNEDKNFLQALKNKNYPIIDRLWEHTTKAQHEEMRELITADSDIAQCAISNADLELIILLLKYAPSQEEKNKIVESIHETIAEATLGEEKYQRIYTYVMVTAEDENSFKCVGEPIAGLRDLRDNLVERFHKAEIKQLSPSSDPSQYTSLIEFRRSVIPQLASSNQKSLREEKSPIEKANSVITTLFLSDKLIPIQFNAIALSKTKLDTQLLAGSLPYALKFDLDGIYESIASEEVIKFLLPTPATELAQNKSAVRLSENPIRAIGT